MKVAAKLIITLSETAAGNAKVQMSAIPDRETCVIRCRVTRFVFLMHTRGPAGVQRSAFSKLQY